jgi:hypothetical protein
MDTRVELVRFRTAISDPEALELAIGGNILRVLSGRGSEAVAGHGVGREA